MNDKTFMKSKLLVLCLCFMGLLFIFTGSSYAYITVVSKQEDNNVVEVGNLKLSYDDQDKLLNVNDAFPTKDEEGLTQEGYTFTVTNTGSLAADYKVMIENDAALIDADGCGENQLPYENLRFSLDGSLPKTLSDTLNEGKYVIATGNLQPGASKTYTIKMWIKEDSGNEILGKHFHGKIVIEGTQGEIIEIYKDTSGANSPVLVDGMIPVRYDGAKWVVADNTKDAETSWYDYTKQEWANAVTVTEDQRADLKDSPAGTEIPMTAINTMWVWIPRYEYDTTNLGTDYSGGSKTEPGAININFIDGTGAGSGENYKVHTAFKFGEQELEGFWYGKFETSNKEQSCTAKDYSAGTDCDQTTFTPQIKPNVTSWRGISPSTAFTVSQKMVTDFKTEYGFSGTEDTHMSKNSEWGAVAYLSQSTYGKYGNENYSGTEKEVYINNCSQYKTGIAGATVSASSDDTCANTYETENGQKASTTGNITGVYDMSGGANEYVMGVLADDSGNPRSGYDSSGNKNSGFNGTCNSGDCSSIGIEFPNEKYYDLYKGTDAAKACEDGICYGHALSETAGWYSDYSTFVSATYPWFLRGGDYYVTSGAGVFSFDSSRGSAHDSYSFRLVLAPRAVA